MTAVELTTRGPAALVDKGYGSGARSTETSAMPVPTGTSLCHRSGFAGNGSRDAHCFIGETSHSVFGQNEFCMEKSDFEVYLPEA